MKKIYTKPCLVIESFATEDVMIEYNVLSSVTTDANFGDVSGYIHFSGSNNNIVTGINYEQFKQ